MRGRAFPWIAFALVAVVALGPPALAGEMTWSQQAREKIDSLNLTDEQKTDIREAFTAAEDKYDKAIGKTREKIAKTLTDDQKDKLASMADDAIQKALQGKKLDRTRSIADISQELGITEDQSSKIRSALDGLASQLDKVDSKLVAHVEKILSPEQMAKVRTWL
jgi:Spy/CpxP family protein refolding chaperone